MAAEREGVGFDPWRRRRRRALAVAAGVAFIVVVALALAGWSRLRSALDDMTQAQAALVEARENASAGDIDAVSAALVRAERHLGEARATLASSSPLRMARLVPGVRQNIDAATELADRAFRLTEAARRLADAAGPLSDDGLTADTGGFDAELLRGLRQETAELRAMLDELPPVDLPSSRWLLSRVHDAAAELVEGERELAQATASLDDGLVLVNALAGTDGPARWLIVAANPSEMRGAGGMILSYAVIESDDGDMSITAIGPEDDFADGIGQAVDVDLPADYVTRYGRYRPTFDIRNSTLSADFTLGATIIEAMYREAMGTDVDGVIQVDPIALAALLDVTGPVSVEPMGEVDGGNLVATVLNELYFTHPDLDEREDTLARVAAEAFDHLLTTDADPFDLLESLQRSLHGRNLMLHSRHPELQERIEALGVSGALNRSAGQLHLAIQNFSGNKLDFYVDADLAVSGEWAEGETGSATAAITITNNAPDRTEPQYVFGGHDEALPPGSYRAHAVLYLPVGSSVVDGPTGPGVYDATVGTENGWPVATFAVEVPAGEEAIVTIEFDLPDVGGCRQLTLVPSPRIRPVTAVVDVDVGSSVLSFDGRLRNTERIVGDC